MSRLGYHLVGFPDDAQTVVLTEVPIREVRISREGNEFRIDLVTPDGITSHVIKFPDEKANWKDERIKALQDTLDEIRKAGGWRDLEEQECPSE